MFRKRRLSMAAGVLAFLAAGACLGQNWFDTIPTNDPAISVELGSYRESPKQLAFRFVNANGNDAAFNYQVEYNQLDGSRTVWRGRCYQIAGNSTGCRNQLTTSGRPEAVFTVRNVTWK